MTSWRSGATVRGRFATTAVALLLLAGCGSDDPQNASDQNAPDPAPARSSQDQGTTTTQPADEFTLTELIAEEDRVAGSDRDDSTDQPADGPPETQAAIEAAAFSVCMRDRGIDFPDLELNDQGRVSIGTLLERIDLEDRLMQSGLAQCQGQLGEGLASQVVLLLQNETLDDALANFSTCVRNAGYDVGDLTVPSLLAGALSLSDDGLTGDGLSGDSAASTDRLLAAGLGLDPDNPSDLAAVDGCDEIVASAISDLDPGS